MPSQDPTASPADVYVGSGPGPGSPLAIQVEDLYKHFRIPTQRVDSLKERAVHPLASREYRELKALDGISFEVRQGEFFGIVGRNGSGKSTLLKLLASIYRADAGAIRIAGRLAPFIELGVGFNHELTARQNVVLNGVMMGLTPKEVRRRLDTIIDFAELNEFADLKLKNYSSGMLVRLAFSVMLEADADVLLIDEVLAVGDAAFQQKCADAFFQMKAAGKTIVLVTHEMAAVEAYCHRAMLLSEGEIKFSGGPGEAGREYLKLNYEADDRGDAVEAATEEAQGVRLLDLRLESGDGSQLPSLERGGEVRLHAELELLRDAPAVHVGFVVANSDDLALFEFGEMMTKDSGAALEAGQRVEVSAGFENWFASGRHFIHFGFTGPGGISLYIHNALSFLVFGEQQSGGPLAPRHRVEATIEERS